MPDARPQIDFTATVVEQSNLPHELDEAINRRKVELKKKQPDIEHIAFSVEVKDRSHTVGAGLSARIKGTIYFATGIRPSKDRLTYDVGEVFNHRAELKPWIATFEGENCVVHCLRCRTPIGNFPGIIPRTMSGYMCNIREEIEHIVTQHVLDAHPDIEPASLIY
jgi:hypothetical protein